MSDGSDLPWHSQGFSPSQRSALRYSSLFASSLSVVLGFTTFVLFLRMRRSFRHESAPSAVSASSTNKQAADPSTSSLIMLFIQADTFENLLSLVFPIVSLSRGTISSSSPYCKVSGFLFAFGIQSSDFAALLIAVHTGLYIFRGHDGLYPFRTFSYVVWFVFAALFASLPFVHGPGYVNRAELCYLPYEPDWVRLAFSWIPRYTIVAAIFIIYTSIYIHVLFVMKTKRTRNGSSGSGSAAGSGSGICHIFRSSNSAGASEPPANSDQTAASIPDLEYLTNPSQLDDIPIIQQDVLTSIPPPPPPPPVSHTSGPREDGHKIHFLPFRSRWKTKDKSSQETPPYDPSQGSPAFQQRSTFREKARRQVRYMFVYPLGYVALWILPFISQQLEQHNQATGPPFPILLLGQVSICLQGAVDSIIFLFWEKPWRYSRYRSRGGGAKSRRFLNIHLGRRVGRTREEMQVDMANARERRDKELAERQKDASRRSRPTLQWWDPVEAAIDPIDET